MEADYSSETSNKLRVNTVFFLEENKLLSFVVFVGVCVPS